MIGKLPGFVASGADGIIFAHFHQAQAVLDKADKK
jgi:hypothetical protein